MAKRKKPDKPISVMRLGSAAHLAEGSLPQPFRRTNGPHLELAPRVLLQHFEHKAGCKGAVTFTRLGDGFFAFGDDANFIASALHRPSAWVSCEGDWYRFAVVGADEIDRVMSKVCDFKRDVIAAVGIDAPDPLTGFERTAVVRTMFGSAESRESYYSKMYGA